MRLIFLCLFILSNLNLFAQSDTLKPDYRNRINIPEYDPSLMPTKYKNRTTAATWIEVNPNVPRVDYLGIHFADTLNGWAVGSNGAIIYSTNGGEKWKTAESNTTNILLDIKNFNSDIIIASGYNKTILRSTNAGIDWIEIYSGNGSNFWEIEIINDSIALVCGTKGNLFKTTDQGESWISISTGYGLLNFWSIDFVNSREVYIACDSGKVLYTSNGGKDWISKSVGTLKHLYRIKVLNKNHIVAGGEQGQVYYTFDGGATWGNSRAGSSVDAMEFVNDSIGFSAGYFSPNFIYKTITGGQSWTPAYSSGIGQYSLMFLNDSVGFNAGLNLTIRKTTNKGDSWPQKIIKEDFVDVWAVSENLAFAIGGGVYKTIDGGLNWYPTFPYDPTNLGLSSVFFVDSMTGFVGTNNAGRIYKTTDSGETWDLVFESTTGKIDDIYFYTENLGFAGISTGEFIRTTNGGNSWDLISNFVYAKKIQFFDEFKGYILSSSLKKTTDGGISWQSNSLPTIQYPTDLHFFTIYKGWLLAQNDSLYITLNGGVTWTTNGQVSNIGYANFCWRNNQKGFINATNKVYETNDSGYTWKDITSEIGNFDFNKIHTANVYSGFAIGENGLVVKYFDSSLIPVYNEIIIEKSTKVDDYFYPNPFNNTAILEFKAIKNEHTIVNIYNLLGEIVQTVFNDFTESNKKYKIIINSFNLSSGLYFYHINNDGNNKIGKILLIK